MTPTVGAGGVLSLVAALAPPIGMLRLLGIDTCTVQTRTRKIGIRMAVEVSVPRIVGLSGPKGVRIRTLGRAVPRGGEHEKGRRRPYTAPGSVGTLLD